MRAKLSARILPFVCGVFILSFLDRVNLSYAAADMSRDLALSPADYGLGAGLFFLGYLLLELPAANLVAKRARLWLAVMMIGWGVAGTAMALVRGAADFYSWRIVLGIAEAGFFPGIIIYLSRWFPKRDRARAISALALGLPAANLIGGPLSALLLRQNWLDVPGWRWLFLIEGIPSILAGLLMLKYLPESPRNAAWLSPEESNWLVDHLQLENASRSEASASGRLLISPVLLLFALIWFLDNIGVYGFNFWLPVMIKHLSASSSATAAAISAIPFIGAFLAAGVVSISSDRRGERRLHTAIPMALFGLGLAASALCGPYPLLAFAMLSVAALGLTSGTPGFWALTTSSGNTSKPNSIAIITSAGALGGFCGPYIMGWLRAATASFSVGVGVLATAVLLASILVLLPVLSKPH